MQREARAASLKLTDQELKRLSEMSDCKETDFFWESLILPGQRKRKKDSKQDKRCLKRQKKKISKITETHDSSKKKKKNAKFKEAMKEKKKKKKKKNRLAEEVSGSTRQNPPTVKPETSSSDEPEPDRLTEHSDKKESKRKKKVAFDISPGSVRVKRPKFVSPPQQPPEDSGEAAREVGGCHSRGQTHGNDSQSTSDDINSQDLFITQKTFRASPSQPSGGEALRAFTQQGKTRRLHDGSHACSQDSLSHQHHRKANQRGHSPKTGQRALAEKAERSSKARQESQPSVQTQTESQTELSQEKAAPGPGPAKPRRKNPFLDEPVAVNPSADGTKTNKHRCSPRQQSPSCLQHAQRPAVHPPAVMRSTSTQTENFFSTQLSLYLGFCQNSVAAAHFEDLKPLDLSLTHRARKDPGLHFSAKTSSGEIKGDAPGLPTPHPSCSSDAREAEVKMECTGRHPGLTSTQARCEVSPRSGSDPRSADTTASSEDSEPHSRSARVDLAQVRAVQTRLNGSFFFKTKGEGQSPRPASPLMKLTQGREVKSKKGH